jgi:lysophospholipase
LIELITTPTVISAAIYPGITGHMLSAQIEAVPTCRAVILSAYGSGNLPVNDESGMLSALQRAVEREILIVVISQCQSSSSRALGSGSS